MRTTEETMNDHQTRSTEQPYYFSYQKYWYYLGTLLVCVAFPSIIVGLVPDYKANERAYFLSHVLPIRVSALWYLATFILLAIEGVMILRILSNKRAKHKIIETLVVVLPIMLGAYCWSVPVTKYLNYQNSEPHSCFKLSSRNVDWVNNECVKRINVDVVDQVIEYTDTKHVTKKSGNKYVEGTEFTVNKTDKTYGTDYKIGDVFFLPDEDSSGYVWADTPGMPALSAMNNINHALGNKSHNKKYVVHTTQKEVIEPVTGSTSNWEEGVTKEFDGKTYFHKSYPSEYYVYEGEQHINPVFIPAELVEK